ncbi:unnamed protein product [Paramecium primaurelia]|uniref:Uncharacterized protein n=1 Tax=Paramecium primaurelia TaxID=5886 RepID=A0A8S1L4V2_PARPR|nr:unnamed protein product [Paramecium primaurelia]
MPIVQGKAKLWHPTQEEQDAYDDKMIANIELKSLDFDDENFSPVFNRSKKEFFLQASERYKKDLSKLARPFQSYTCEEFVNKYIFIKPNHTYWREWTVTKWMSGFGLGYLVLRELPLRNFYARVFVMWIFLAKLSDHFTSILPYHGKMVISTQSDRFTNKDINQYHNVCSALNFLEMPTFQNRISESLAWRAKQPAHLLYNDTNWCLHILKKWHGRSTHIAHWDGTFNQPLERLADPYHKDAHFIHWI